VEVLFAVRRRNRMLRRKMPTLTCIAEPSGEGETATLQPAQKRYSGRGVEPIGPPPPLIFSGCDAELGL
jgi:hypothetical protein